MARTTTRRKVAPKRRSVEDILGAGGFQELTSAGFGEASTDPCYLIMPNKGEDGRPKGTTAFSFSHEMDDRIADAFGDDARFVVHYGDDGVTVLQLGEGRIARKVHMPKGRTTRSQLVVNGLRAHYEACLGWHRHVYYDVEILEDGVLLTPNGKVEG